MKPNTTSDKKEPMKVQKVPVVYADRPGRNRNIYSEKTLEQALTHYKKVIALDSTYKYSMAKHPKDVTEEWLGLVAGACDDIYYVASDKCVYADFTIFPSSVWGNFIIWLIENGYEVGTSLRGKAQSTPTTVVYNGESMRVEEKHNLLLEGVDFVIYPSYIVTHVSDQHVVHEQYNEKVSPLSYLCTGALPYSDVFESYISEEATKRALSSIDIKKQFIEQASKEKCMKLEDIDISVEKAKLAVEKLTVESQKLEQQQKTLLEEVATVSTEVTTKKEELAQLTKAIEAKQHAVKALDDITASHKQKLSELENAEKKLTEVKESTEVATEELANIEKTISSSAVVHIAGKTFTDQNRPRLRVVPVNERTTAADWSKVNKDSLKKLISLCADNTIASLVCGVAKEGNNWQNLAYATYQPFKSTSPDYDIDLVLNVNAVTTVANALLGQEGMSLSKEDRISLGGFVKTMFDTLQAEGIQETPAKFTNLDEKLQLIETFQYSETTENMDKVLGPVFESFILNGFNPAVDKQTPINLSLGAKNLKQAILATLHDRSLYGPVAESTEETDNVEEVISRLLVGPDGSPTEFADAFGLTTAQDFNNKFILQFKDMISSGDVLTALSMIQTLVAEYAAMTIEGSSEGVDVRAAIRTPFKLLLSVLSPNSSNTSTTTPVTESAKTAITDADIPASQEPISSEDEIMFEDVKKVLESSFQDLAITDAAKGVKVIAKLVQDYQQLYTDHETLVFTTTKNQRIHELMATGLSRESIEDELKGITDVDELNVIADKMLSVAQKVQESTQSTTTGDIQFISKARRVAATTTQKSNFSRMMRTV